MELLEQLITETRRITLKKTMSKKVNYTKLKPHQILTTKARNFQTAFEKKLKNSAEEEQPILFQELEVAGRMKGFDFERAIKSCMKAINKNPKLWSSFFILIDYWKSAKYYNYFKKHSKKELMEKALEGNSKEEIFYRGVIFCKDSAFKPYAFQWLKNIHNAESDNSDHDVDPEKDALRMCKFLRYPKTKEEKDLFKFFKELRKTKKLITQQNIEKGKNKCQRWSY